MTYSGLPNALRTLLRVPCLGCFLNTVPFHLSGVLSGSRGREPGGREGGRRTGRQEGGREGRSRGEEGEVVGRGAEGGGGSGLPNLLTDAFRTLLIALVVL